MLVAEMLFDKPCRLDPRDPAQLGARPVDAVDDGVFRYAFDSGDFFGGAMIEHVAECRNFQRGEPLDRLPVDGHAFSRAHCSGC